MTGDEMKFIRSSLADIAKTVVGCILFSLGFQLFLMPNDLNAGGISGLSMVVVHLFDFGRVGILTAILNLPIFALGGIRIGRKFFLLSLLGMLLSSVLIDVFAVLPHPNTEPLIGALYGGALCGLGLGIVFSVGGSTGGSDIIVRLLKRVCPNIPLGMISMCFDLSVAVLTGIVFGDISRTLYSGVSIFIAGRVMDAVIYRFDYSRVAIIVSKHYQEIADAVTGRLGRGVTYLYGAGFYTNNETKVVLTAVKRQQLAELKQMVVEIDPQAFIIVQEAHQVLGDGFSRYSKDAL